MSSLPQLRAPMRGALDGVDEGGAEAGVFEDREGGYGGAGGSGDHVLELGGVTAGLDDHSRRAKDRLGGKLVGELARQARLDAAVDERLYHEIDVGGTAAG